MYWTRQGGLLQIKLIERQLSKKTDQKENTTEQKKLLKNKIQLSKFSISFHVNTAAKVKNQNLFFHPLDLPLDVHSTATPFQSVKK